MKYLINNEMPTICIVNGYNKLNLKVSAYNKVQFLTENLGI
jgi:hypothetical protein